jgi:hypothetical protein
MKEIFSARGISNVLLHIALISTFIGVFFFTYGRYIEQKIVEKQTAYLVHDLAGNLSLLGPTLTTPLKNDLKKVTVETGGPADQAVAAANKKLMEEAAEFLGGFLVGALLLVLAMWQMSGRKFSLKRLFVENATVLAFVAFTEFFFLTFVGQNYRSIDPNVVKLEIIKNLEAYAKKNEPHTKWAPPHSNVRAWEETRHCYSTP